MSCQQQAIIGQSLTFTLQTKKGAAAADADSVPTYSIYEEETGTAIATGSMAKLDDAGTTGFYSEKVEITTAIGYELYKSYTIRIIATINSVEVVTLESFMVAGSVVAGTTTAGSGKTLSNLRDICYYHGWQNKTTEGIAALDRFINRTLYLLSILAPWPEYHKRDGSITLVADTNAYELDETNISRIGNVVRSTLYVPLTQMKDGIDGWLEKTTILSGTGAPLEYALRKYVSSGMVKMELLVYPTPSAEDTLYYAYWLMPTELSLTTDETDWPNYRMFLLEEALEKRIASSERDNAGVALESPEFMALVRKAMADSRPSYMPLKAADPIDRRSVSLRDLPIQVTT